MTYRKSVFAACIALLAAAATPAVAAVTIRVGGTGTPEGADTKAMEVFKQSLETQLGREVTVQLFPASQLGTWSEMVE